MLVAPDPLVIVPFPFTSGLVAFTFVVGLFAVRREVVPVAGFVVAGFVTVLVVPTFEASAVEVGLVF